MRLLFLPLCLSEISVAVIKEFRTVWDDCPNSSLISELWLLQVILAR